MEFFVCAVDGRKVLGKFHKVGFRDGDEIEFVVEEAKDSCFVKAARCADRRTLWVMPYRSCGHSAKRRNDVKWSYLISFVATIIAIVADQTLMEPTPEEPWYYPALMYAIIFFGFLGINFWARGKFAQFSNEATEVFACLGFEAPAEVDLDLLHRSALKRLEPRFFPSIRNHAWSYLY